MSSEKPDQIQASVAAALSRLRGDLGPSSAAAPKIDTPAQGDMGRDMARPANDVRADPFFKSIQSAPAAGTIGGSRGPIPMTPFARMQAAPETASSDPSPSNMPEPSEEPTTIEMPPMPRRAPDLIPMPEPTSIPSAAMPSASQSSTPTPTSAATPAAAASPQPVTVPAGGGTSPLSRMMRGTGAADPAAPKAQAQRDLAQRDLLADLPPPISEPLTSDTESSAMRRRRRNRRMLAAAAVIVVVAVGAWLWRGSEQSTEVPVITADATPEKVKPANEEGTQVPNQNIQVLDPTIQSQNETVMPAPEQPVTPPAPSAEQPATTEQAPTVVENTAPDAGTAAPAADTPPAPETPLATAPLPEQGENDAAGTAVAPPAAPATQPEQTAEAPAKAEPAPVAAEPAPAPAQAQPEPAQAAQPEPTATQEAAVTPTVPAGSTRVQLAAGKSEDAVKKQWAELQKAHPDLLGALTLNVERVDKGAAGIFYRLQAGPLADKVAAKKLCASLKQAHQDCLVVK
jgi:hypothetical protein